MSIAMTVDAFCFMSMDSGRRGLLYNYVTIQLEFDSFKRVVQMVSTALETNILWLL